MNHISSFPCFFVSKVSHHGILEIHQQKVSFIFTGGSDFDNTHLDYSSIKKINVENHFSNTMNTLEIYTDDQILRFTGLREAQAVKDLIGLIQQTYLKPKLTYGFSGTSSSLVQWKDLEEPILLYSCTIPKNMDTVYQRLLSKDFFYELYGSFGDQDIVIDDWSEKCGFKERKISFIKILVLPVIGRSIVKVSETQRLFDHEKGKAIAVLLNLGKTPYADCIDPQVQLFFIDKGDSVEFLAKFQIIWLSQPFVKNIIDKQTTLNIRAFYTDMGKQLLKELGHSSSKKEKEKKEVKLPKDEFTKFGRAYKVLILFLGIMLLTMVWKKYIKPEFQKNMLFSLWKLIVFCMFLFCLLYSSKPKEKMYL